MGVAGCVISLCRVGWWMVKLEGYFTGVNINAQAPVGQSLHIHGHQIVNFFHMVEFLTSVKQLKKLLSMYFREELKIL